MMSMIRFIGILICIGLSLYSGSSIAEDAGLQGISIERPWTRATPKTAAIGAGYMTINNRGVQADRLISAKSELAQRVELHVMTIVDDIMRMRPVEDGVAIPVGGTLILAPGGGHHLMLVGLREQLEEGMRVPLFLQFEKAGWIPVELLVEPLRRRNGSPNTHSDRTTPSPP